MKFVRYSVCCALVIALTGCSVPKRPATVVESYTIGEVEAVAPKKQGFFSKLFAHYADWQGTPYKYGGTTKQGVDCSAFVALTYAELFDVHLPRTTKAQAKIGDEINRWEMEPGDLVLFKTTPRQRHVGIYIGEDQFMHASSRKGVTISKMDNPYWSKRFWKAVRTQLDVSG
jgi:cell wall-associated NlpC family hydrolase